MLSALEIVEFEISDRFVGSENRAGQDSAQESDKNPQGDSSTRHVMFPRLSGDFEKQSSNRLYFRGRRRRKRLRFPG